MSNQYLFRLPQRKHCGEIGNKAKSLNDLLLRGYPVPPTWICCNEAFLDFNQGREDLMLALRSELEDSLDPERAYAVRSSATLEDGPDSSYAGQFKTVLEVSGIDQILESIQEIWGSAFDPGIQTYQAAHQTQTHTLGMSVIIQEMVLPVISGVAFSVNPVTGMNEIVIEALPGSGEALVQDGLTPARWVRKWGSWVEEPAEAGIDRSLIEQVSRLTEQIASGRDQPVDLEWVYDGSSVYLVQAREVTALDIPLYSNHISREVFPGLIKPLIWSVNVPLVNGAWVRLLTELIGPNDIQPEDLARSFFNRAYFNMGTIGRVMEMMGFPRQTLELLMGLDLEGEEKPSFKPSPGTLALLPRMLGFALGKIGFGKRAAKRAARDLAHYRSLRDQELEGWSDARLLDHIEDHFQAVQETAYYNVVTPLLMQLFNLLFDRTLNRLGVDPRSFSFGAADEQSPAYNPYRDLQELSDLFKRLPPGDLASLQERGFPALAELESAGDLSAALDRFLDRFGHLSDSGNDFSSVPWRESPDLVLAMIIQHDWEERTEGGIQFSNLELSPLRRWRLIPSYRRAKRFQRLREQVGTAYTMGYGLFRNAFLELGRRLASRDLLDQPDDVMYLKWAEIKKSVLDSFLEVDLSAAVQDRKRELEESARIHPPTTIYGDAPPATSPGSPHLLTGTPTSRGSFTGPAVIVRGLEDMDRVQSGDVLVVPYSDVSWTPLFAKAGAVVAEAGGILSHSSIIAREYGIPAVVAVPGATQIQPGIQVTVDGNNGQVMLHRETDPGPDQLAAPRGGS